MNKITKPAVVCEHCGSNLKNAKYDMFCDYCKTNKIEDINKKYEITIFWKEGDRTTRQELCSVKCVRSFLLEFPFNKDRVDFMTLPCIYDMSVLPELLHGNSKVNYI